MIFNTWTYALFLIVTFLVYWFVSPRRWRSAVLLVASYVFFTYHYLWHALLIFVMTVVVYGLSLFIFRFRDAYEKARADNRRVPLWKNPKLYLIAVIIFCVGTLSYYKYLKMAIATLDAMFETFGIHRIYHAPSLIVPLGISFFVFEFIHYAVDAYQGKAEKVNFFRFAVFIMYFPTLVSGPIKRYQIFVNQMFDLKKFQMAYLNDGLYRILIGMGKKVIIADRMTVYAEPLLHPYAASTGQLWIAMYAYAVKIYMDFSGYSDIAIGSAKLFGYEVPENFNWPYLQRNLAKFWNNWHMSLSSWIRDYIYIPLGGSRGTTAFAVRNNLIAMAISGLWHGAAWHFVAWGTYHGIGLAWLRYYSKWKKEGKAAEFMPKVTIGTSSLHIPKIGSVRQVVGILITFQFVSFGWILFYCPSIKTAAYAVVKMFGGLGIL